MTLCANCRRPLYGRFCSVCGTPANAPRPADNNNLIHGVIYLIGLWSLIFLFIEPYKRQSEIRFHVFQNMMFIPLSLVLLPPFLIALFLTPGPAKLVPIALFSLALLVIGLAHLWAIIAAFIGKPVRIPLLGDYAEKLAAGNLLR